MIFGAYNITAEFQIEDNPSITVLGSVWYNTEEFKDWMYIDRDGGLSAGVRQYFNRYEDQGVFHRSCRALHFQHCRFIGLLG